MKKIKASKKRPKEKPKPKGGFPIKFDTKGVEIVGDMLPYGIEK